MALLKQQQITDNDSWQLLGAEDELPAGDVIVPFTRWQQQRDQLLQHEGRVGVLIQGETAIDELVPELAQLPLIAVEFPIFRDGRCYSHARLLRDRYNYQGEIRAVGEVLRDQLAYMARCGIDSFQLGDGQDPEAALGAFADFTQNYQPAADLQQPITRQRH